MSPPSRKSSRSTRPAAGPGAWLLAAVLSGAGCTSVVRPPEPPVAMPKAFSQPGEADLPEKWWTAFGDARLGELIERALRDNLTLRGTWDRLEQARAAARRSAAPLLPALDGTAGASRTLNSFDRFGRVYSTGFELGLSASYELDLWGRVRSAHGAAGLDVEAGREDLRAAAITLAASVAEVWIRLIEQGAELRLLDEQIDTNGKYVELITVRYRQGKVTAADVLQQRQLLEATQGERVRTESSVAVLRHQLAVLLGRGPAEMDVAVPEAQPHVPALPRTGVPAERIHGRPDVRAALLRVEAADRRVAVAIAEQFPRLSLSVRSETAAERIRELFDNWLASMAANAIAPLFDAGSRAAEVDRARASASESFHAYGRTVLTALREVEDALVQEAQQRRLLESLSKQVELSGQSVERTRDQYTKGTTEFLRFLTTVLEDQRLQRTWLQAQRDLVLFRIDLYRALGGGWEPAPPPPDEPRRVLGPVERVGEALLPAAPKDPTTDAPKEGQ
ncbi:MAG TPA: TolC family protein [Phycisphaerae bacterium]|nr:TolC family protein [Phycisphaerae bacterium]